jgi:hypothetical protein
MRSETMATKETNFRALRTAVQNVVNDTLEVSPDWKHVQVVRLPDSETGHARFGLVRTDINGIVQNKEVLAAVAVHVTRSKPCGNDEEAIIHEFGLNV